MMDTTLPQQFQDIVMQEIAADETVVWNAMPKPSYFNKSIAFAFLLGIPWTAFTLFWMANVARFRFPQFNQQQDVLVLFGLPFLAIGGWMLSLPLWRYRKFKSTVYLITDCRALIIEGGTSTTIRSFAPEKLTDIFRREYRDGLGDVIVARFESTGEYGAREMHEIGFERIPNPRVVEALLKKLAEHFKD